MSFCSDVKSELCAVIPERECCVKALLNSAIAFFNTVGSDKIKMNTENAFVVRYINMLINSYLHINAQTTTRKSDKTRGYSLYIEDKDEIYKVGRELGLINETTGQISGVLSGDLCVNECCQRAVVKGAFLISGSVTDPKKSYHFEISNHRKKTINDLNEILISMDFPSKVIKRGSEYILYIKEKEAIADILNLMGNKEMFFKYHDIILMKEVKNQLNRKQNFEYANLDKTVNAAVEQKIAIENLIKNKKFDTLPPALKEIALLRINNPEDSLSELAKKCSEPITRSGINHRLKKIVEMGLKG